MPRRQKDDPAALLEGYEGFIFACVNIIASKVAGTPLRLYRDEEGRLTEIHRHPLLTLVRKPNPYMTGYSFLYLTTAWVELAGNAYWVRADAGLWPLPPQWVRVVPGEWPRVIEGYIYNPPWLAEPMAFSAEEVIHFKRPNPQDPLYYGASTLQAAFGETELWRLLEEYRLARLERGGVPPAAVVLSEEATPEDLERIRAEFRRLQELSKGSRPAILPPGTEIRLIELPPVDKEFVAAVKLSRENILAIFGVPASKLGLVEDVNRANAEANDLTFAKEVIEPRLRFLEEVLNAELAEGYGEGLLFRFDSPVPQDRDYQLRRVETLVRLGVMSPEEARREMGL